MHSLIIFVTVDIISFLTSFIVDVYLQSTPVDAQVFIRFDIFTNSCSVTSFSLNWHCLFLMVFQIMAIGSEIIWRIEVEKIDLQKKIIQKPKKNCKLLYKTKFQSDLVIKQMIILEQTDVFYNNKKCYQTNLVLQE